MHFNVGTVFLHRLLVRLNIPGNRMPFLNFDPTHNIRLLRISLPSCPAVLAASAHLAMDLYLL
jgi:hypothetical protein